MFTQRRSRPTNPSSHSWLVDWLEGWGAGLRAAYLAMFFHGVVLVAALQLPPILCSFGLKAEWGRAGSSLLFFEHCTNGRATEIRTAPSPFSPQTSERDFPLIFRIHLKKLPPTQQHSYAPSPSFGPQIFPGFVNKDVTKRWLTRVFLDVPGRKYPVQGMILSLIAFLWLSEWDKGHLQMNCLLSIYPVCTEIRVCLVFNEHSFWFVWGVVIPQWTFILNSSWFACVVVISEALRGAGLFSVAFPVHNAHYLPFLETTGNISISISISSWMKRSLLWEFILHCCFVLFLKTF